MTEKECTTVGGTDPCALRLISILRSVRSLKRDVRRPESILSGMGSKIALNLFSGLAHRSLSVSLACNPAGKPIMPTRAPLPARGGRWPATSGGRGEGQGRWPKSPP